MVATQLNQPEGFTTEGAHRGRFTVLVDVAAVHLRVRRARGARNAPVVDVHDELVPLEVDGAPIIDGLAAVVKTAEMLVDLKAVGIERSRTGLFVAPNDEEFSKLRDAFS